MDRAESQIGSDAGSKRSGLSPLVAFATIFALALAAVTVWLFSSTRTSPSPSAQQPVGVAPSSSPESEVLTEAEAIAEFERTFTSIVAAIEARSSDGLDDLADPNGSTFKNAAKSIREHKRDNIVDRSRFRFVNARLIEATPTTIELQVEDLFFSCFESEDGRDVTKGPRVAKRLSTWTLKNSDVGWRIWNGTLEDFRTVKRANAGCR